MTTPIEDTYKDVERLISHMCHRFVRQYGGDFEEHRAEANLVYLDVYRTFDHTRNVPFSHVLCTSIYRRLLGRVRYNRRRAKVWSISLDAPLANGRTAAANAVGRQPSQFNLGEFVETLSSDAAVVVQLVLDAPQELVAVAEGKGGHPSNWSSSIRSYLRRQMRWSPARVREAFNELSGAVA